MQPFDTLLKPILSEKSTKSRESEGQYAFRVKMQATKDDIQAAVAKMFNVKVVKIQTMIAREKAKRRRNHVTPPRKYKKAIVTLAEGQKLPLFEDQ